METTTPNISPTPIVEPPLSNRLLKILGNIIVFIIGLFLLIYFLLQVEFVQNFVTKQATNYLSKELQTTVKVDRISIDFFDKLVLENFYAEDFHGDTLLYSESLTVNFNTSIVRLLNKELKVDDLTLSNTQLYMRRYPNERRDDFAQLLDKLGGPKKEKSDTTKKDSKPFFLDVDALYLRDIEFIKDDSVGGEELRIVLPSGDIFVDSFNLSKKLVLIKSIELSSPYVTLINFDKNPLPVIPIDSSVLANTPKVLSSPPDPNKIKWRINMADFALNDGTFIHHQYRKSPKKTTPDNKIDYSHLDFYDINIKAEDFGIYDWVFTGESKHLSLKERSGFQLDNLSATKALVTPNRIELYGMALITPYSSLGDTLIMKFKKYPDFKDFPEKVRMDGKFDESHVSIKDIMAFAPALNRNPFFAQNKEEVIYINGQLKGRVNNLKGKNLDLRLGESFKLKGDFNSHNLNHSDEAYLNLNLTQLRTDMNTLRQLIPNFNPPENFNKLGEIDFKGRFTGFFIDFVANGSLQTDLGLAQMDMNLNIKEGREQAQYSGQLSLIDFDLEQWTGDKNFGKVTFSSKVQDGKGLTANTADAKLLASIDQFSYKGYNYENLSMNGNLNKNLFTGNFGIQDDNIDFLFKGEISFEKEVPDFNFHADVKRVDLKSLNLIKEDFVFAGAIDLNLRGKNVNDVQGFANIHDLVITRNQVDSFLVDTLSFSSGIGKNRGSRGERDKLWRVNSEILAGTLIGDFELTSIGEAALQFFERNFAGYANRFNIHSKKDTTIVQNQFTLDLTILDSKNFTQLIDKNLDTLKGVKLHTYLDYTADTMSVILDVPQFGFGNIKTEKIHLETLGGDKEGEIDFSAANPRIGKFNFDYISLLTYIENDSAQFNLNIADAEEAMDKLNVDGKFAMAGEQFSIEFLTSDLVILNTDWKIAEGNYLLIGKNFIKTQNFEMTHEDQKVALSSLDDKGLLLEVAGFNAGYIDTLWDFSKLNFEGDYALNLRVDDIFKLEGLQLNAIADTFHINLDSYGELELNAKAVDTKSPIDVRLTTRNGLQQMELTGFYNPPSINVEPRTLETSPNYLDIGIKITKYPLHLAEYFVTSGISNTIGDIDAKLYLNGLLSDPNLDGTIRVYDGATTLDYTKTRYSIRDETVKMTNEYLLDATGGTIFDDQGNSATITGGITHKFFNKLALDCRVQSNHFTVINTKKGDNPVYYGTGIGKGDIYFTGDFNRTNIDIKATTAKGTNISIPVTGESSVEETSFIRFEIEDTTKIAEEIEVNSKSNEIKGIQLKIYLEMTDAAEVSLIFDEQAGDIMSGKGYGNIEMDMNRSGDIRMFGNYELEEGKYLFTLKNIINKAFTVKRGGLINWTGDPYNALINIDAEYKGLSTAPYNFILEYLNEGEVKAEARKPTNVDLTMGLTGQLLTPDITFSIDFPNLTGELKNYTDNKIRSIALDENQLNKQVFGLIVIGSFLPSDQNGLLAGNESQLAINTLSELLSNQLSIYLTDLLSQGLAGVEFLDVENFGVNYNQYDAADLDNPNDLATGHELSINPTFRVKDRWIVNIAGKANLGGGYLSNNSADALVTGDFIVEYELTKDRRLKVTGYYKNEPEILGGRRNNAGLGLSFRKEFDGFEELFSFLKKSAEVEEVPVVKKEKDLGYE